jgi:4-amino-4-deoxy-L-arabinose transferase-like glycosyltransferase
MSTSQHARSRSFFYLASGLVVAAISLAIMIATEPFLAIVWDEGYSLGREARVRAWFGALRDPAAFAERWQPPIEELVPPNRFRPPRRDQVDTRGKLLSPAALDWFWPFAREEPDGHPPVYALVGLLGDVIAPGWEPLPRARLGPMLVFSLTCGAIFLFFNRRWGAWSALAATAAWVFQPHLFALAHYATYDGLLTSFWAVCVMSFAKAVERTDEAPRRPRFRWVVLFGLFTACAMGTKLTGWLLQSPFLAWVIVYRDRRGMLTLLTGTAIAVVVLAALIPPWWTDPLLGVVRFLQSNLSRAETTPLKTLFLGTIYETPSGSLPWYNTAVLTLLVTPVGFLVLASVGATRAVCRPGTDTTAKLILVHWAFLMVLRALPHTPGHDGVRQFLPAFGMLALLAGLGAESMLRRLGTWGKSFILLAVAEGALSVAFMMPVPLSYYSPVVGGLPGAARLGMEPTYYWDALQPEILDWLNSNTAPGEKVMFSRYPTSWLYLRQIHKLRVAILPNEPGSWVWYVVQNRTGALRTMERDLVSYGQPSKVFVKCGVPLLWVFPYRQVEAWQISR